MAPVRLTGTVCRWYSVSRSGVGFPYRPRSQARPRLISPMSTRKRYTFLCVFHNFRLGSYNLRTSKDLHGYLLFSQFLKENNHILLTSSHKYALNCINNFYARNRCFTSHNRSDQLYFFSFRVLEVQTNITNKQ